MKLLLSLLLLFTVYLAGEQQSGCKVRLPNLAGHYEGGCKKGLAQGKGIAQGIDHYEGNFFKGLPDGKGIYTWADGSSYDGKWKNGMRDGQGTWVKGDSVVTGFWKADKYLGKRPTQAYSIISSRNVARYTITKTVEPGNGVKIRIMHGGVENSEIVDFSLAYTSGNEYRNGYIYGIQYTAVPLEVTVRYTTWNQLHSVQYDVLFEFSIREQGVYNVILTNI